MGPRKAQTPPPRQCPRILSIHESLCHFRQLLSYATSRLDGLDKALSNVASHPDLTPHDSKMAAAQYQIDSIIPRKIQAPRQLLLSIQESFSQVLELLSYATSRLNGLDKDLLMSECRSHPALTYYPEDVDSYPEE